MTFLLHPHITRIANASPERLFTFWYLAPMEVVQDAIYFEQLARVARAKADVVDDPVLAVRL